MFSRDFCFAISMNAGLNFNPNQNANQTYFILESETTVSAYPESFQTRNCFQLNSQP